MVGGGARYVGGLLLAVAAGLGLGLLFAHLGLGSSEWTKFVALPGQLWLKALKCIVLPMIVFSMVGAMVMLRSLPCARYIGAMVMALYIFTTVIAAVESCVVASSIMGPYVRALPQDTVDTAQGVAADLVHQRTLSETIFDTIENLVPKNFVDDAARANLLPVIVASIVFGLLVVDKQPDGSKSLTLQLVDEVNQVVIGVVTFLMTVAPFGVGALVFRSAASLNLADVGASVGYLILACVFALAIHAVVFYPILLLTFAQRNPIRYMFNIMPAMMTAVGTSSSAATLPITVSCVSNKNGIAPYIADFVLSLGATVNMDGTTGYLVCATYFLGKLHGVEFTLSTYLTMTLLATLCSIGTAPIPSASLVLLATILTAVGIPLDETFGLVTAVDWIVDRLRTVVNVTGDATAAAIVDRQARRRCTDFGASGSACGDAAADECHSAA